MYMSLPRVTKILRRSQTKKNQEWEFRSRKCKLVKGVCVSVASHGPWLTPPAGMPSGFTSSHFFYLPSMVQSENTANKSNSIGEPLKRGS